MLPLLLVPLLFAAPTPRPQTPVAANERPPARVAIIGASVSQGFGLSQELEVTCTLTPFVDSALRLSHEPILNLGDGMMFQGAVERGARQLEEALAIEPTLLIAADFPFWFGYGSPDDLGRRLARLERGLELLEQVECPLLIGDFPDMSGALQGQSALTGGKPIVGPSQIPSPEQLERLNARLRAWAAQRENVHVFAMSSFMRELQSPETLVVRGNEVDAETKKTLLQSDLLHPTVKGTALFTVLLFDQLVRDGVLDEEDIEWRLERLEAGAREATKASRDKLNERRRRREERKRELEERKRRKREEQQSEQQPRRVQRASHAQRAA